MEPVNLDRIREASMGDDEFMEELIDIFLDDMPQQLEILQKAVLAQDTETAVAAAHRLKGACGNVGAQPLSDLCQELERLGRENCLQELPGLLREVDQESIRVRNYLSSVKKSQ